MRPAMLQMIRILLVAIYYTAVCNNAILRPVMSVQADTVDM